MDLVDLRVLRQNLIGQFLRGRQHLCVVHWYQVLDELLQLVSAHLEQGLWDGQVQFDLLGLPYSVKWQRHYMGAVEDVFVSAGARYRRDLTAVEADAHAAYELRGWWGGRVCHCATQMKTWKSEKENKELFFRNMIFFPFFFFFTFMIANLISLVLDILSNKLCNVEWAPFSICRKILRKKFCGCSSALLYSLEMNSLREFSLLSFTLNNFHC